MSCPLEYNVEDMRGSSNLKQAQSLPLRPLNVKLRSRGTRIQKANKSYDVVVPCTHSWAVIPVRSCDSHHPITPLLCCLCLPLLRYTTKTYEKSSTWVNIYMEHEIDIVPSDSKRYPKRIKIRWVSF